MFVVISGETFSPEFKSSIIIEKCQALHHDCRRAARLRNCFGDSQLCKLEQAVQLCWAGMAGDFMGDCSKRLGTNTETPSSSSVPLTMMLMMMWAGTAAQSTKCLQIFSHLEQKLITVHGALLLLLECTPKSSNKHGGGVAQRSDHDGDGGDDQG